MMEDLIATNGSRFIFAIAMVGLALGALVGVLWLLKNRTAGGLLLRPTRLRTQRLTVLDSTVIDAKRRLVLVRRDDVEHLLLIGGPADLVVETRIGLETDRQSSPAMDEQAPPAEETDARLAALFAQRAPVAEEHAAIGRVAQLEQGSRSGSATDHGLGHAVPRAAAADPAPRAPATEPVIPAPRDFFAQVPQDDPLDVLFPPEDDHLPAPVAHRREVEAGWEDLDPAYGGQEPARINDRTDQGPDRVFSPADAMTPRDIELQMAEEQLFGTAVSAHMSGHPEQRQASSSAAPPRAPALREEAPARSAGADFHHESIAAESGWTGAQQDGGAWREKQQRQDDLPADPWAGSDGLDSLWPEDDAGVDPHAERQFSEPRQPDFAPEVQPNATAQGTGGATSQPEERRPLHRASLADQAVSAPAATGFTPSSAPSNTSAMGDEGAAAHAADTSGTERWTLRAAAARHAAQSAARGQDGTPPPSALRSAANRLASPSQPAPALAPSASDSSVGQAARESGSMLRQPSLRTDEATMQARASSITGGEEASPFGASRPPASPAESRRALDAGAMRGPDVRAMSTERGVAKALSTQAQAPVRDRRLFAAPGDRSDSALSQDDPASVRPEMVGPEVATEPAFRSAPSETSGAATQNVPAPVVRPARAAETEMSAPDRRPDARQPMPDRLNVAANPRPDDMRATAQPVPSGRPTEAPRAVERSAQVQPSAAAHGATGPADERRMPFDQRLARAAAQRQSEHQPQRPAPPPVSGMGQVLYRAEEADTPPPAAPARLPPRPPIAARPDAQPAIVTASGMDRAAAENPKPALTAEDILEAARSRVLAPPPPARALAASAQTARQPEPEAVNPNSFAGILAAGRGSESAKTPQLAAPGPTQTGPAQSVAQAAPRAIPAPPRPAPVNRDDFDRMLQDIGEERRR
ncbi:hypothetical protein BJF93_00110 [Xaviernesmea oryzae]|uniref:Flagellar biosynthesis protein FliO n=1 Tax=Xaviernesmea oryzae TaxID=464029 RepID=A0A1Q9B085_9HYPH|nr:flagellar biosynthetic protein FliO [Xaviernesmea oryzae]OLP61391.1 hypothetical protein BJF93_00110 [Xaviernesmea oryzae]SEL71033.1 Flagellar biosynthesis protein, FliO [Xaviernesmea oryzae]